MAKLILNALANLTNETTAVATVNTNNNAVTAAMEKTLSRDGTSPNNMNTTLDMNGYQVINLPAPVTNNAPLRLQDLATFIGGPLIVSPMPAGGSTGYLLTKRTNADYDAIWKAFSGGFRFNVLDFGAVADGVTDCAPAFNAAIQAAFDFAASAPIIPTFHGAAVYVPAGNQNYRIASTINMKRNVSLIGDGGFSTVILADNTDGITFNFSSGGGDPTIQGIMLSGVNMTSGHIGIKRIATTPLNSDDGMAGLTIRDVLIEGFNTAVDFYTVLNVLIDNCRFQNVNQGIAWRGFGGASSITNTKIIKLAGGGTGGGTFTGIDFIPATYTSGATPGTLGPEGVNINNCCVISQFAIGVNYQLGNWYTIENSNVVATQYGIKVGLIGDGLSITNCAIEMQSSTALAGVWCVGQTTAPNSHINIHGNTFLATSNVTVVHGIQVNDASSANQDNIIIENNSFTRLKGYDIAFYNPGGRNRIVGNRCGSTGNTGSILIGVIQTVMTVVQSNVCANTLTYGLASDLTSGFIRRSDNVFNGGTRETPSWNLQSSVAPFFTVAGPTAARIYTFPDATDTVTTNAAVQTLTNKTLTSPAITTPTGIVKGDVGLGNVDNTSDATKNAAAVALANKTITASTLNGASIDNLAWTVYTPTPTAAVPGTSVLTLNSARYKQIGKTVIVQGDVSITTAGTGSGTISFPLPFTAAAFNYSGAGTEKGVSARFQQVNIAPSGTAAVINDVSGTPIAFANGARYVLTITYETV